MNELKCFVIVENPSSEFHISAKYVNSSAVNTEIYHVVNRQRVTDILMAVRLNNSHLLHGRLHWRPEMMDDIRVGFIYNVLKKY